MISVCCQGKSLNITVIQVCAPTTNAKEAEGEWFYEDLKDLLQLTPKRDVLFIIGNWNAKLVSQEIPGVTDMFVIPDTWNNRQATSGFPGGSAGKESTCSAGDWVQSLGQEDPQEKGIATHSSILA